MTSSTIALVKNCLQCSRSFPKDCRTSLKRWNEKAKLCSKKCSDEFKKGLPAPNKGRRYTPDEIERIFPAERRRQISEQMAGNQFNLGRKLTEEHKKKIGAKSKGHLVSEEVRARMRLRVGPLQSNWKGGISPISEAVRKITKYKEWRAAVFKRDGYRCRACGATRVYLHADHIKPFRVLLAQYREQNGGEVDIIGIQDFFPLWDIANGRTLCVKCHRNTPTYGYH